jgi:hypothetical protein
MNELIEARMVRFGPRGRGGAQTNAYSKLKAKWQTTIATCAFAQKLKPISSGFFTYLLVEPNRRRNPSNVHAGAVKLIEDALVQCKLMPNDGWGEVKGLASYTVLADEDWEPGVLMIVEDGSTLTQWEAFAYKSTTHKIRKTA